jgi:ATP-dependent Clp protease ATP-binding subunit ClpB
VIRFDKFTQKAQEALQQSQEVAGKSDSQVLYPLHLLVALSQEREGIVRPVLEKCGVQPDAIVTEGERLIKSIPKVNAPPQPGLYASQPFNEVVERAFDEASRFKDEFVSTEHLLLAISAQKHGSWCAARSASPIPIPKPSIRHSSVTPWI